MYASFVFNDGSAKLKELKSEEKTILKMIRPLVLSGPSGCGKSTLLKKLMEHHKNCFAFCISHTTRNLRPGEVDGKDYFFTTRENFHKLINDGKFLEHAEFAGNLYGTSLDSVHSIQNSGKICVLDIDMEGVKSVKKSSLNARYVFIKPPTVEALEHRLKNRGTETEETIKKRLDQAKSAMDFSEHPGIYDLVVVNDDLDVAFRQLEDFLKEDLSKVNVGN